MRCVKEKRGEQCVYPHPDLFEDYSEEFGSTVQVLRDCRLNNPLRAAIRQRLA